MYKNSIASSKTAWKAVTWETFWVGGHTGHRKSTGQMKFNRDVSTMQIIRQVIWNDIYIYVSIHMQITRGIKRRIIITTYFARRLLLLILPNRDVCKVLTREFANFPIFREGVGLINYCVHRRFVRGQAKGPSVVEIAWHSVSESSNFRFWIKVPPFISKK